MQELLEALDQIAQLSIESMNSHDVELKRKTNALIANIALRAMAKAKGRIISVPPPKLTCEVCGEQFPSLQTCMAHIEQKHIDK